MARPLIVVDARGARAGAPAWFVVFGFSGPVPPAVALVGGDTEEEARAVALHLVISSGHVASADAVQETAMEAAGMSLRAAVPIFAERFGVELPAAFAAPAAPEPAEVAEWFKARGARGSWFAPGSGRVH